MKKYKDIGIIWQFFLNFVKHILNRSQLDFQMTTCSDFTTGNERPVRQQKTGKKMLREVILLQHNFHSSWPSNCFKFLEYNFGETSMAGTYLCFYFLTSSNQFSCLLPAIQSFRIIKFYGVITCFLQTGDIFLPFYRHSDF